jgi:hypothetical protein
VLSQLENGDELPNCFLERRRLGRPLPCAIRLCTQRSDHMAVIDVRFTPVSRHPRRQFNRSLARLVVMLALPGVGRAPSRT